MSENDEPQFTIVDKRHGRESGEAPEDAAAPTAACNRVALRAGR